MAMFESKGEYHPSERGTVGTALTFLLIGLGIGAGVALLFTPRTGKQMRTLIRRGYEDAVENINETTEELVERGKELIDRGAEVAGMARERVTPLVRKAKV